MRSDQRDACIWLGTLASWRRGLVKRLVRTFGGVEDVLAQAPNSLAQVVRQRPSDEPRASSRVDLPRGREAAGRVAPEQAVRSEEERRFLAVLNQGPRGIERASAHGDGQGVVAWCDDRYPSALRDLSDPPLCLFVRAGCGTDELERRLALTGKATAVAVVGTRGPSPYGRRWPAFWAAI